MHIVNGWQFLVIAVAFFGMGTVVARRWPWIVRLFTLDNESVKWSSDEPDRVTEDSNPLEDVQWEFPANWTIIDLSPPSRMRSY